MRGSRSSAMRSIRALACSAVISSRSTQRESALTAWIASAVASAGAENRTQRSRIVRWSSPAHRPTSRGKMVLNERVPRSTAPLLRRIARPPRSRAFKGGPRASRNSRYDSGPAWARMMNRTGGPRVQKFWPATRYAASSVLVGLAAEPTERVRRAQGPPRPLAPAPCASVQRAAAHRARSHKPSSLGRA